MDDIGLCIEKAVKRGRYKAAILLALRFGWIAVAAILSTTHEQHLTARDKVEIVSAFAQEGLPFAYELASHWRVRRKLPFHVRELIDTPRKERHETATASQITEHPEPFRRAG